MSNSSSSNKVAFLALISLIPIFIFVIGNGWATILAPYVQTGNAGLDKTAAFIAGGLFGFVAVILAWAVASERARLRHETNARYTWLAYLGLLIALSAIGTMNWLFKVSEVPTFITESAEKTKDDLQKLNNLVLTNITLARTDQLLQEQTEQKNTLSTLVSQLKGEITASLNEDEARQERERANIMSLFDAFEQELVNPIRAGCGEVAQGYIEEIKAQLPDLRLPSGSCRDAEPEVILTTYKAAIDRAMDRIYGDAGLDCAITQGVKDVGAQIEAIIKVPPAALGSGCPSSESVIRDTEAAVEKYIAALPRVAPEDAGLLELREGYSEKLNEHINNIDAMIRDRDNLSKETAEPVLIAAWMAYRSVFNDLGQQVDESTLSSVDASIDDQLISKIGNVANTIEILMSRYDHISTYPIVLAGIFFDMILIAFFYRLEAFRNVKKTGHRLRMEEIQSTIRNGGQRPL